MPIPRIAIVGRPNVGKSSLMNMIARAKVSIVDPTPGVTRDRVAAIVELPPPTRDMGGPKTVEFIDTGGFGVYVAEGARYDEVGNDLQRLTERIELQIARAVESADVILFAVDAQAGVTPHDREIARMLREGAFRQRQGGSKERRRGGEENGRANGQAGGPGKNEPAVRVVATKVDGPRWEAHAAEVSALGFGEPLMVSAKNNYMRRDFLDALWEMTPEVPKEEEARADMLLAIIGKRNAGKSTLVNTLAGEERVIASEIPGTTRDAVDVRLEVNGRSVIAIDTAGLRKKKSFQNLIEHFAFDRVQRAVDRSTCIFLLIDATEPVSQVDEQLAMLAQKSFKPVVIVVNKWDLVEGRRDQRGRPVTTRTFEKYVRDQLRGLWYAPISFVSGATGMNLTRTIDLAFELQTQSASRVTTGILNRLVREIVDTRGPSDEVGHFAKVYYVAQTGVSPPTITLVVNRPEMFTPNYLRFLSNRFREQLPFPEVPIRIVVRARRQREDDLAREGEPARVRAGMKGVRERLAGSRVDLPEMPEGDAWLDDAFSMPAAGEDPDADAPPQQPETDAESTDWSEPEAVDAADDDAEGNGGADDADGETGERASADSDDYAEEKTPRPKPRRATKQPAAKPRKGAKRKPAARAPKATMSRGATRGGGRKTAKKKASKRRR